MASRKRVKKGEKRGTYRANDKVKSAVILSLQDGATVAAACKAVHINRSTFYDWCKDDAEFGKQVGEAQESRIQHVEDALYRNAIGGLFIAQMFFLCNRASDKWKNVQKIEPITHKIEFEGLSKLPIEELKKIRDILKHADTNTNAQAGK